MTTTKRRTAEVRRELLPADVRRRAVTHLRGCDPVMARVVEQVGPCRMEIDQSSTLFAALSRSILYQQISGLAAAAIHKRLIALCGGHEVHPADILAHSIDELRAVGLSRQKATYMHSLAEHVSAGLSLASVRRVDDEEAIRRLTAVKGVGRWTAEILLMFRLGRLDLLPVADYGIQKAMQKAYGMRSLPRPKRMRRIAAAWSPYRTVACWYLWRFIDGEAAV
ncbi:MAG: DNA-3-methyladenine glycosylase 2 family protein [Vicinamibacteria bacterium]|nr:DNA-3-methyladenine glycosylase 2 family protein [Vicinamibacteria bacterium]